MKDNKFTNWVKKHEDELCIVGGVVVAVVGTVMLANNWDKMKLLLSSASKHNIINSQSQLGIVNEIPIADKASISKIVDIREHLRNLPQGHHPSALKITEAAESGITLNSNQTLVSPHSRRYII